MKKLVLLSLITICLNIQTIKAFKIINQSGMIVAITPIYQNRQNKNLTDSIQLQPNQTIEIRDTLSNATQALKAICVHDITNKIRLFYREIEKNESFYIVPDPFAPIYDY